MSSYLFPFIATGIANGGVANNANFANYAGNVTVSTQPNITSVGNLTSLTVVGNVSGNNILISNIANISTIISNGNANLTNLNSNGNINFTGSNVSLGSISNLHITGGTNGYVLQTDGTGNLTWTAQTGGNGNGTVAGANTQVQYNNAGNFGASANFTFNSATNNVSIGGNIISIINNANINKTSGQFPNTIWSGNTFVDFNLLSGTTIINLSGIDNDVTVGNVTSTYNLNMNLRGNASTTLANTLNLGETLNFIFLQRVGATCSNNIIGNTKFYNYTFSIPRFRIDGTTISDVTYNNESSNISQSKQIGYPGSSFINWEGNIAFTGNISSSTTLYHYNALQVYITKITNTPNYIISYDILYTGIN